MTIALSASFGPPQISTSHAAKGPNRRINIYRVIVPYMLNHNEDEVVQHVVGLADASNLQPVIFTPVAGRFWRLMDRLLFPRASAHTIIEFTAGAGRAGALLMRIQALRLEIQVYRSDVELWQPLTEE